MLNGSEILMVCDLAAACTTFSASTIRRWASDVFGSYFLLVTNIDDVSDERLELELTSGTGKHPKWPSLMTDENFQKGAKNMSSRMVMSKAKQT